MNNETIIRIRQLNNFTALQLSTTFAVISVLIFCFTQLAINANLNPKGIKLESLNTEKNALVEENRMLEQEIAQARSIKIITQISDTKLDLNYKGNNHTVYLTSGSTIIAKAE